MPASMYVDEAHAPLAADRRLAAVPLVAFLLLSTVIKARALHILKVDTMPTSACQMTHDRPNCLKSCGHTPCIVRPWHPR